MYVSITWYTNTAQALIFVFIYFFISYGTKCIAEAQVIREIHISRIIKKSFTVLQVISVSVYFSLRSPKAKSSLCSSCLAPEDLHDLFLRK